jgi:N,N'-diacetyllegionaminate synthase
MLLQSIISKPDTSQFYVYAETAFHHEGSLAYLEELVDAAAESGAHGVKFQLLLDADSVYSAKLPNIEKIRSWCFGPDDWLSVISRARNKGLDVIAMPIDMDSMSFIMDNISLVTATEIHSICFNEVPLIDEMSVSEMPVLLNIGGRIVNEIDFTLDRLATSDVALIYGLQNFPTDPSVIHLGRIPHYAQRFGRCMGYADHTTTEAPETGTQLCCHAYVLGCRIFERHITTERDAGRVDHEAAVLPADIRAMIVELERTAQALGSGSISDFTDRDAAYRKRQKQIVYARDMAAGESLVEADLAFMVTTDTGDFDQLMYESLAGKRIARPVTRHSPVLADDLES